MPITKKKELLPEHELLNQYDQHVRHCPSCSKVLAVFDKLHHPLDEHGHALYGPCSRCIAKAKDAYAFTGQLPGCINQSS